MTDKPIGAAGRISAIVGGIIIATIVIGVVFLASFERKESFTALLQEAGHCSVASEACSLAFATWLLGLIAACAFVATIVAAAYTARAASETRNLVQHTFDLARHTSLTAEETKRLANAGDRLAVGISNCDNPQAHAEFVPAAELWVNTSFELKTTRPPSRQGERVALFEATQFGPVGILNFEMRATICVFHDSEVKEMGSCVVSLGDVGSSATHFSFAFPEQMELKNVRVIFSEGRSLIDPSREGDPVVQLSRARHQFHVLAQVARRT